MLGTEIAVFVYRTNGVLPKSFTLLISASVTLIRALFNKSYNCNIQLDLTRVFRNRKNRSEYYPEREDEKHNAHYKEPLRAVIVAQE